MKKIIFIYQAKMPKFCDLGKVNAFEKKCHCKIGAHR